MKNSNRKVSLSALMTGSVTGIVLLAILAALVFFIRLYEKSMEENAITNSEQSVVQVMNTIESYTDGMKDDMELICRALQSDSEEQEAFISNFVTIRSDVVAVTTYNAEGGMENCWSDGLTMKSGESVNLSQGIIQEDEKIHLSQPHVESLFENYYPWVVTAYRTITGRNGELIQVSMDLRFSGIANYVDDVGIGKHGYCFVMDTEGNLIYHPQQQLIYSGLKSERTGELQEKEDGYYAYSEVIYTVRTLENSSWRVVGVSYVDEMITNRVASMVRVCLVIMIMVLLTAFLMGYLFSRLFGRPAKQLAEAMKEFEHDAEGFHFTPMEGTQEIQALAGSFDHMVIQIQQLMEQVREEEISLRKTELKALQAQINPHFLYNTLDSIAWMCEEERSSEAVEMVNALARLFRISISRGKELIPLEKEVEHAQSYLKIQNYRYRNQFTYDFHIEEDCLKYLCNKITLQPIIENAIYHGLDRMVDEGHIDITIRTESEDTILLVVEDTGVGMTEEQCHEILYRENSDRVGIGIKNVNDRIRIYFGEKYGLKLFSELDEGTRVEIRIPRILESEYEVKD